MPYADLLDGAGGPKAADDPWTVLTRAGALRYVGLVCFADAPGEAAIDQAIRRLMGHPDLKVWMQWERAGGRPSRGAVTFRLQDQAGRELPSSERPGQLEPE